MIANRHGRADCRVWESTFILFGLSCSAPASCSTQADPACMPCPACAQHPVTAPTFLHDWHHPTTAGARVVQLGDLGHTALCSTTPRMQHHAQLVAVAAPLQCPCLPTHHASLPLNEFLHPGARVVQLGDLGHSKHASGSRACFEFARRVAPALERLLLVGSAV